MYTQFENSEIKENINMNEYKPKKLKQQMKKKQAQPAPKKPVIKSKSVNNSNIHTKFSIIKTNKNKAKNHPNIPKPKKKIINVSKYYQEKENYKQLHTYGGQLFSFSKTLDNNNRIPSTFLIRHKIPQEIHMKMVNWLIEIISIFGLSDDTFFLSIKIMDSYIHKKEKISTANDIHIIGVTSIFIASKFQDVYPLQLYSVVEKIAHKKFKKEQILSQEKKIIKTISFESLICVSPMTFIRNYFVDFVYNNDDLIIKLQCSVIVSQMETIAVYIAKILLHFDFFYTYQDALKAIACMMTGYGVIKEKVKNLTKEQEKLIFEWLQFIISKSDFSLDTCMDLYLKVTDCFECYHSLPKGNRNLEKFCPLHIK